MTQLKKWQPHYGNDPQKFGERNLLETAFTALQEATDYETKMVDELRDKIGRYAIETQYHILLAKQAPYGYIVSVDAQAIRRAIRRGKQLLIYIDESKYFYEFNPAEVQKNSEFNYRGERRMINFDIKLGVNYLAKREKIAEIRRKALGITQEQEKEIAKLRKYNLI